MYVIEHLDKAKDKELLCSYEIVPPPRGRSVKDLTDIVQALEPFKPSWIDVTAHSAGAYYNELDNGTVKRTIYKKRPGTIGICGIIQNRFKIDTVAHLLTQGFTKEETEDALIELNYLGIHNVLALKGDGLNYKKSYGNDRHTNEYAIDLVKQITELKKGHFLEEIAGARELEFGIGVAGYPEKHFEAPSLKRDIQFLKEKIDAGADYVTTQMFFDNAKYFEYVKECRELGITAPLIPGIKIIKNINQLKTIPRNFHVDFPDEFVAEMYENPDHAEEIGIRRAITQCEELVNNGAPCLHFYIMNDTKAVIQVVKKFR